jgi:hypothetical protein
VPISEVLLLTLSRSNIALLQRNEYECCINFEVCCSYVFRLKEMNISAAMNVSVGQKLNFVALTYFNVNGPLKQVLSEQTSTDLEATGS